MATRNVPRHVILTGLPGSGKTTLVQKACDVLQKKGIALQGFYTEEMRQHGKRTGFDVVTLDGLRGPLARVDDVHANEGRKYRVGPYTVKLHSFENLAIQALREKPGVPCVYVIDEVGKMEMFSVRFVHEVRDLLENQRTTVLTTIPVAKGKPIPFVEEIRHRKDALLVQVTKENRDQLLDKIVQSVLESHEHYRV